MATNLGKQQQEIELSQKALEDRGQFTQAVLANVGSGVVSVDPDGKVSTVNNAVFELLQQQPQSIEGQDVVASLGADFARAVWKPALKKLDSADQVTFEVPYKNEHGHAINLGIYAVNLKDEDSNFLGSVVVFDDVTYQANLQRVAAWKEVARRVAHEIKNPLTPIKLNAERALRKFASGLPEKERSTFDECMRSIVKNVDQLTDIVEEFRKFARMPSGRLQSCDLSYDILGVVEDFRLSHPHVEFDTSGVASGYSVSADKSQMSQVFVNLINNALDAVVGTQSPELIVRIGGEEKGTKNFVIIEVEDNGVGIPADQRLQVFEPYYTTRKEGTGLGLAIVNRIINEHGGEIKVLDRSFPTPGAMGTRFEIRLPEVA